MSDARWARNHSTERMQKSLIAVAKPVGQIIDASSDDWSNQISSVELRDFFG